LHLRAIMFLTLSPPLPPLMDFPAGYFAVWGGGGGGVWQVGARPRGENGGSTFNKQLSLLYVN